MLKLNILIGLVFILSSVKGLQIEHEISNSIASESGSKISKIVEGYPFEEYEVTTPDEYILKVIRISGSPNSPPSYGKTVVFLQHGLLSSSADWLVLGRNKALAYLLADQGYDVWLGNARGNTLSRKHQYLSPNRRDFWDFSWHQIGQIDLPAMIDFVLLNTGQKNLHYIGHSQGTTAFFVMASLRTEMNAKIKTMQAFAPVAFMSNLASPFLRIVAPFADSIDTVMSMLGVYEFLPSNEMLVKGGQLICKDESPIQEVCANVLFLIGGFNSPQLNRTIIPAILENTPAGSSVDQLVHYAQGINSGKFRMFDFGLTKNLFKYGSIFPPDYKLSSVTAPVFLHYSNNDWLAALKDVNELKGKLGNVRGEYFVPDMKFNHLDFIFATDADILVYNRAIDVIANNL
ncbi:CLUMA_CG005975, isoform A [Clunio marinus]|uniref:Lipase n=1 Tax=Clunio marinus TaxID=568069 RepID=A0A1J1I0Q7_9DIPT|nr:CLUMA_CG005975, isoform A [Clunio marinus]